ncbi:MAG: NAD(P)-dependent glycerol-3-phosphate dehydrogenase [Oscillospiraceae bacterium]|nr:NAD(P)-dependent glycerol-3-phosphate dehydrogenase [Oscillospiraceae bacterium]
MAVDIAVLGSGGFGLALAVMLDGMGHHVTVRSRSMKNLEQIRADGENKAKLPGVKISDRIALTDDISCVKEKDIVIFAVPTSFVRDVAHQASPYIGAETVIVNAGKGLEAGTYKRMSEVLHEEIPQCRTVVLSGPSHAEEIATGMPTTIVAACEENGAADYVQSVMSNDRFRVYINNDVVGCELGGALKNIIALCAGICDGVGYGDNTKAALMTRGISEITRLGVALGAKPETFSGLTGIGDLIVTCTSMHSRNRRAGILIGKGIAPREAVEIVGTVEGYFCTTAAYELSQKLGISMPITESCYNVLVNGRSVQDEIRRLMGRPKRHETEEELRFFTT